jgi:hypothetical protein
MARLARRALLGDELGSAPFLSPLLSPFFASPSG